MISKSMLKFRRFSACPINIKRDKFITEHTWYKNRKNEKTSSDDELTELAMCHEMAHELRGKEKYETRNVVQNMVNIFSANICLNKRFNKLSPSVRYCTWIWDYFEHF